jgi:hypothetical protein
VKLKFLRTGVWWAQQLPLWGFSRHEYFLSCYSDWYWLSVSNSEQQARTASSDPLRLITWSGKLILNKLHPFKTEIPATRFKYRFLSGNVESMGSPPFIGWTETAHSPLFAAGRFKINHPIIEISFNYLNCFPKCRYCQRWQSCLLFLLLEDARLIRCTHIREALIILSATLPKYIRSRYKIIITFLTILLGAVTK